MSAPIISYVLAAISLVFIGVGILALVKLWRRRRAELRAYAPPVSELTARDLSPDAPAPSLEPAPAPAPTPEAAEPPPAPAADTIDEAVLGAGLTRSQASLWGRLQTALTGKTTVDEALVDELEVILLGSDLGVTLSTRLLEAVRKLRGDAGVDLAEAARETLRRELLATLAPCADLPSPMSVPKASKRPYTILFVGVNGVGKTTTVGKLAHHFTQTGHKVTLAAGDTFRAAAAEQLEVWAKRTGARLVRGDAGADPASVMYNAMAAATAQGDDVVLADTAGRLHNKSDLMAEIAKIRRAIAKHRDGAPDETWLVVDATTGQNALVQAEQFHQAIGLSGVVLTKLDGSAKGGVAVGIVERLNIPVRLIGLGESAEALQPFVPEAFIKALI